MKKQLLKMLVLMIIWGVLLTMVIINRASANDTDLTVSINTNKSEYRKGEDIEVTIKLNKDVMTTSFYLNYNSSLLSFKSVKEPSNVAAKDYPTDNLVRVVYADMNGVGVDEIKCVFTVKAEGENANFSLSNASMTTSEDNETYSQGEITGINNTKTIVIKQEIMIPEETTPVENSVNNEIGNSAVTNSTTNTTESKSNTITNTATKTNTNTATNTTTKNVVDVTKSNTTKLPNTGKEDVFKYLLVALIIVTIYLGYNAVRYNNYLKF